VIARVRREGYATAVDELEVGLTGMAAPVLGAGGRAIAALSISGPTLRLGSKQIEDLYPTMIDEAQALGQEVA
jgi:DNA-binding IclR family transcriptional regulator